VAHIGMKYQAGIYNDTFGFIPLDILLPKDGMIYMNQFALKIYSYFKFF